MSVFEKNIFKRKKFSDILEEIYENQKDKQAVIKQLVLDLKPLVKDIGDATLLVPLIKEYLDVGIKNDEQLIKMATIIQRAYSNMNNGGEELGISEKEKRELMEEFEKLNNKK